MHPSNAYTVIFMKEWSLRAFADAIQPIGSRYLLSFRNLIGYYLPILEISCFLKFQQVREKLF